MSKPEKSFKGLLVRAGWTPPGEIVGSNEVLAKRIAELTRQLSAAQEELRQVKANARRAVEMMEAALNAPTY